MYVDILNAYTYTTQDVRSHVIIPVFMSTASEMRILG